MRLIDYAILYGEANSKFKIRYNDDKPIAVPLWFEKFLLKNRKYKKFRIRKKIFKKELEKAIKSGDFGIKYFYLSK